ncbi:EexN family lipoprotein [Salmonella enterica]|nr:EexN family lipoprotein [Salmonella enterica]
MLKKTFIASVVVSSVLLSGCKEETKSIEWYKHHPNETYEVYSKCKESGDASPNCEFARRAARYFISAGDDEKQQEKFRELYDR